MREVDREALARTAPTDEILDAKFYRPLAAYVVRAVRPTRVTPNQLTCLCMFAGMLSGWCIAHGAARMMWAGATLLVASLVLDCSDGQLARERGGGSTAGRILDGLADYIVAFSVHLGVLLFLVARGVEFRGRVAGTGELFLFVLAAGVSMAFQSALFDFYKHRFLFRTGLDYRKDAETAENFRAELERASMPLDRLLIRIFIPYLRFQEWMLERGGSRRVEERPSDDEARDYARRNATILRAWSLVGPTGHMSLLAIAAALTPLWPDAFVAYALFAIFPQNLYAVALLGWQSYANHVAGGGATSTGDPLSHEA